MTVGERGSNESAAGRADLILSADFAQYLDAAAENCDLCTLGDDYLALLANAQIDRRKCQARIGRTVFPGFPIVTNGTDVIFDDVYVLNVPFFQWVKIFQEGDAHWGITRLLRGKKQMLTIGGGGRFSNISEDCN